jgi:heme-degrading monooxygenase HmoA
MVPAEENCVVVVFRSRLRPDAYANGYGALAVEMERRARTRPGFVDFKTFVADDGERVSIVIFDSFEHEAAWRDDPEHRRAQRRGRELFYEQYAISICEQRRSRRFGAGETL